MSSFELVKAKPPKNWITPILWGIFLFFAPQIIVGVPVFILLQKSMNIFVNKRSIESLGFHKEQWLRKLYAADMFKPV